MPRDIWELQRLRDVKEAIQRYLEDGRKIPMEWVNEFNELLNKTTRELTEEERKKNSDIL